LVVLPKKAVVEVLPALADNRRTPSIMFFGNNAEGPGRMIDALGRERVLLGFPGAAAVLHEGRIRYVILSEREQPTTIGELEANESERLQAIAKVLRVAGFPVAICSNMDAWLKTHAAEMSPTASALYMSAVDVRRLARTRDALTLMLRAIREGYAVLTANGIPITPKIHKIFEWLPEPLLVNIMRRMIQTSDMDIKIGHAVSARAEMKVLADDLRALSAKTSVAIPAMERLYAYLEPSTEPMVDGSAELPLEWGGVWLVGLVLGAALVLLTIAML
jgi:2-dehydropantoate 2-reductase